MTKPTNDSAAKQWPTTVDEAVGVLLTAIPEEQQTQIAAMQGEDLITLHFGLGMWIRNHLGLWEGNGALLRNTGQTKPDDASMVIIEALWRRLREQQPKIQ